MIWSYISTRFSKKLIEMPSNQSVVVCLKFDFEISLVFDETLLDHLHKTLMNFLFVWGY